MTNRFSALQRLGFSTISMYLELIGSFVISVIIARHLGPEDYGVYTFIIWLSGITVAIANLGVNNAAIKFIAEAQAAESPSLLVAVRRKLTGMQLIFLAVAIVGLIALAPLVFIPRIPEQFAPAIWLLVVASAAKAFYMFLYSVAKGLENFRIIAIVASLVMPLNFALVVIAALTNQSIFLFVFIYTGVSILSVTLMGVMLRRAFPKAEPATLEDKLKKRINHHVLLVSLASIVYIIGQQQIEVYFLSLFSTRENIAFFSLSFSLAKSATDLFPGVLNMTILPMLARTFSSSPNLLGVRLLSTMRYMLILGVPVALLGFTLAHPLILIVYGESYLPAVMPLKVFMGLVLITSFSHPSIGYLVSVDKQHVNLKIGVFGALLNIILDIVLISRYGLEGAVAAASITILIAGSMTTTVATRSSSVKLQVGVSLRILLAGLIAIAPVLMFADQINNIVMLIVGSLAFFCLYVPALLIISCWSRSDLSVFLKLLKKSPLGVRWLRKLIVSIRGKQAINAIY